MEYEDDKLTVGLLDLPLDQKELICSQTLSLAAALDVLQKFTCFDRNTVVAIVYQHLATAYPNLTEQKIDEVLSGMLAGYQEERKSGKFTQKIQSNAQKLFPEN